MFNRLIPRQIGDIYRGNRVAIWILIPIVLLKLAIGFNSTFNTYAVATGADGIPLDRYGGGGAETVIAIFAIWGLFTLLLALQSTLVLIFWRALIPFTYLLWLCEQLGRKALLIWHPIETAAPASAGAIPVGVIVNWGALALLIIGFTLSLINRVQSPRAS